MGRTGTDSGSATLFLPTARMQSYDDYFCVFGMYDTKDSDNEETLLALTSAFDVNSYEEFVIYYTGEYGNLTFNCVKKANFVESEIDDLFKAEEGSAQLVCYNHYTIKVPMTDNGQISALIKSAKIK